MNDPDLAAERFQAVVQAYENGVPQDEAWSHIRNKYGKFEGHLLKATIENVYEEGMGID